MKIGDTYEQATCLNCGRKISHEYWGNGGTQWVHTDSQRSECQKVTHAYPAPETVAPTSD